MTDRIKGGYVLKPRCIKDSWIAHAPPVVRETWDWLLLNACHSDQKYNGYTLSRGQLFCSQKDIIEALHWRVGYRKVTYSEGQTKRAMKALVNERMIDLANKPRGCVVTICNYNKFQSPKIYERPNERTNEQTIERPSDDLGASNHLQEGKELKNVINNNKENLILISEDYFPAEQTIKDLKYEGIDSEFTILLITEFVEYWGGKEARTAEHWERTFKKNARHEWERR